MQTLAESQKTGMKFKTALQTRIEELFGIDLRSLAFFRIALALLILADLIMRATDLRAHYTDFGLLPRGPLLDQFSSPGRISIHLMGGTPLIQAVLFLLNGLFAFMLLVGYRTRLATFLCWFFMISLHARNPFILQGGDPLFHMLLFWSLFLPLGACWSIDNILRPRLQVMPQKFISMVTVAYFAQIIFVYGFSAAHKLNSNSFPVWWKEGSAVYYTLSIDQLATSLGHFLLQFPWLLKFFNYEVLYLEIIGPLFLVFPIYTPITRMISILLLIGLQLGFGLCLALGPFPWVCSVAMLPFLPSFFWERLFSLRRKTANQSTVSESLFLSGSNPGVLRSSIFAQAFVTFCLIYVLLWNVGNLNPNYAIPEQFRWFGMSLGLDQRWNMFAPPLTGDGWYVAPGKLKNGKVLDVFKKGAPVSWDKPPRVSATFKNLRWRKYMMDFWLPENYDRRLYFGKYLCWDWNGRHQGDEQLESFEIFYMLERTLPDFQPSQSEKLLLWKHWCFKLPPEVVKEKADALMKQLG